MSRKKDDFQSEVVILKAIKYDAAAIFIFTNHYIEIRLLVDN